MNGEENHHGSQAPKQTAPQQAEVYTCHLISGAGEEARRQGAHLETLLPDDPTTEKKSLVLFISSPLALSSRYDPESVLQAWLLTGCSVGRGPLCLYHCPLKCTLIKVSAEFD